MTGHVNIEQIVYAAGHSVGRLFMYNTNLRVIKNHNNDMICNYEGNGGVVAVAVGLIVHQKSDCPRQAYNYKESFLTKTKLQKIKRSIRISFYFP